MPTVANLLSKPMFKNFRLVSGKNGLNNNVTSAGFFEWEQDFQITKSFSQGEFVLTTLASLKDDMNAVDKSLKLLINNSVSAIAIKDIYYNDISDDLKQYSDKHNVPILFFAETYIDEILYAVKNETINSLYTSFNEIVLDTLISNANLDNLEKENLIRKINPLFHSTSVICAYISNDTDMDIISSDALEIYNNVLTVSNLRLPESVESAEFIYSFIAYKRGIFLMATCNTAEETILDEFKKQLIQAFENDPVTKGLHIGISNFTHGFNEIKTILINGIFANTTCILDKKNILEFSDTEFDYIVFRNCYMENSNLYYDHILERLSEADSHRIPLLETLLTWVSCNGNVDLTAQKMYQHKNTIRYRINKLHAVFSADNDMEFYGKAYFFSRIYFAKQYLNVFFN